MKLGFVSAILAELELKDVVAFASVSGFDSVELMCWPQGKAERRYAGVTHIDVADFSAQDATKVKNLMAEAGVEISGLGYYPNPLTPDTEEAVVAIDHIKRLIKAAALLDVKVVNTFIGRDWTKSIDDNWPRFKEVWPPLITFAEKYNVCIGIENCPMFFTYDEWPSGKNLAYAPAIWRRMFEQIPSKHFGLNYDPSHLVWQHMDYIKPLWTFADRIVHVHAKDARIDYNHLDDVGILATPLEFHTPKLPGLGDIKWGKFLSVLSDVGYKGHVSIEVEDRAYEGTLENRKQALLQSARYLKQFMA